jgi:hypothetical protein
LAKTRLLTPAFIGVAETVSLCLLSYRTAAHLSHSSSSGTPALSVAAAAALRSPTVVAPSNNLEILRNFSRSSCSVVIERFRGLNHRKQYAEVLQKTPQHFLPVGAAPQQQQIPDRKVWDQIRSRKAIITFYCQNSIKE